MTIITRTQALALIQAEAENLPFPRINAEGEALIRSWLALKAADPVVEAADMDAWLEKAEQAAGNAAPTDSVVPVELRPWQAVSGRPEALSLPWSAFDWEASE